MGTRIGPVNLVCAVGGLLYLGARRYLTSERIVIGGLLLAGFLGLPLVLYSKDLLTPVFVILGALGVGTLVHRSSRRRAVTVLVIGIVVISGSIAFDSWNAARAARSAATTYWAMPGVTEEAQNGNLWMNAQNPARRCAYGNNAVLLQQVTNEPAIPFCMGSSIDQLINLGPSAVNQPATIRVVYHGITSANPSDWFSSPDMTRTSQELAGLPQLDFQAGRALLVKYNVSFVVVDLQKPYDIPAYGYQGAKLSPFFAELWLDSYPVFRSSSYAIFWIS